MVWDSVWNLQEDLEACLSTLTEDLSVCSVSCKRGIYPKSISQPTSEDLDVPPCNVR